MTLVLLAIRCAYAVFFANLASAASYSYSSSIGRGWLVGSMLKSSTLRARAGRRRPHPWSTVHPYISWTSLTDQTWSARHLPGAALKNLPPPEKVSEFFQAANSGQTYCKKSTLLFPAFAQYLTDGFIRTVCRREQMAGKSPISAKKHIEPPDRPVPALWPQPGANTGTQIAQPGTRSQRTAQVARLQWRGVRAFSLQVSEGREKTEFEKLDRILGLDQVAND